MNIFGVNLNLVRSIEMKESEVPPTLLIPPNNRYGY